MSVSLCCRGFIVGLALALCAAAAGCVTKAKAKAQADAAYQAGQRDAMMRLQQVQTLAQNPTVRVNGPVKNPLVPWTPNLTLSQAIMAAEYHGIGDPTDILVVRGSIARHVDLNALLKGQDIPLQAGDTVQIVAVPQPSPR